MNRAARMYEVLRDGKPHSRREIFDRAGFMLTNNAASELRAQGHEISQWRERDWKGDPVYFYALGSSPEPLSQSVPLSPSVADEAGMHDPSDGGNGRDSGSGEQLSLEAA